MVLESLRYDEMDDRRDRLNSAERGTFNWMLAEGEAEFVERRSVYENSDDDEYGQNEGSFEDDAHSGDNAHSEYDRNSPSDVKTTMIDMNFAKWLAAGEKIPFCFMGKPGSGKSTLMYV